MNQNLVDNLSITQIKRSNRAELIEIAMERNIELEQAKTVNDMREVIIAEVFGGEGQIEKLRGEQINPVPEVGISNLSAEQQVAFKKLEWDMEMKRLDRESEENEKGRRRRKKEKERQFQIEKLKMEHEFRMREGELRRETRQNSTGELYSHVCRVSESYRLVPVFEESHVVGFFPIV